MATLPTTFDEFMLECGKFFDRIQNMQHTQENIQGAFKALTLQYLGLKDVSNEELEQAASMFKMMHQSAQARGWEV